MPDKQMARPYKAVLIIESVCEPEWRHAVAEWLVRSGCEYAICWGTDCADWEDSIDWADLEAQDFDISNDAHLVMTTQHEGQQLNEAFWFCGHCAAAPGQDFEALLLHITPEERETELIAAYLAAQDTD